MRKLLNTIYITNENAYLGLNGENLICKVDEKIIFRVPFDNIENIVCFSYLGCSPALMGKCVSKHIPINFISPQGKFLAKVCGETKGNVFLRVKQIDCFRNKNLLLTSNTMAAKFYNCNQLIKRSLHDNCDLRSDQKIKNVMDILSNGINKVYDAKTIEEIVGIEGNCARAYFSIFDKLITNDLVPFEFKLRTKHPPLDPVNTVLSFVYTLLTNEYASALETVGLDSYIGYLVLEYK